MLDLITQNLASSRSILSQKKQNIIPRKYQLVKTFKKLKPTRDNWKRPDFLTDPNLELWFTDGSNVNRFRAEIYGSKTNHRESIPMEGQATVFQAEMLVILRCMENLIKQGKKQPQLHLLGQQS